MQQLDLETQELGRRSAGENLRGAAATAEEEQDADPFRPAEGVELRIGEGIGWEDFGAVYDRDDSTKGTTNPKSHQDLRRSTATSSQRLSGSLMPTAATAAAPILMLPSKMQSTAYLNSSRSVRRSTATARIFPKKAAARGGGGNSRDPPEYEPRSPKVSCIGKVLSDRERGRRRRNAAGSRFFSWLTNALCSCGGGGGGKDGDSADRSTPEGRTIPAAAAPEAKRKAVADLRSADPEPSLGTMKRFASGRKLDSWGCGGGECDAGDDDSGHLDRSRGAYEHSVVAGG